MPRIFMTYDELAHTFGGDALSARHGAIECGLSRFKGSDGVTYVGLSPAMTSEFLGIITRIAINDAGATAQAASLTRLASVMRAALSSPAGRVKKAA